jgi:hypothetical protein
MASDNESGLEWYQQASLLGSAIVQNQSFAAFVQNASDASTAWTTDDVAGTTINLINLRTAINRSIPSVEKFRDGIYFAQDEDGMFTYVVVRGNKLEAVFVDIIEASEQAVAFNNEGQAFPLFTYDVQTAFGSVIDGTPTLVYQDRGAYYPLVNGKVPATSANRITFAKNEATGIDEEATLTPSLSSFGSAAA